MNVVRLPFGWLGSAKVHAHILPSIAISSTAISYASATKQVQVFEWEVDPTRHVMYGKIGWLLWKGLWKKWQPERIHSCLWFAILNNFFFYFFSLAASALTRLVSSASTTSTSAVSASASTPTILASTRYVHRQYLCCFTHCLLYWHTLFPILLVYSSVKTLIGCERSSFW